jgi:hypothetical protein
MYWGYDLTTDYRSTEFTVGNQEPAFYSVSEFTVGEFTGGALTSRRQINATGGGSIVTVGLESAINGFPLSLQEINVLVLIGKTL